MCEFEFYTLEVKSASSVDFLPCEQNGQIEKFDSFESAIVRSRYYSAFKSDCVIRVVRHLHASCVECEISNFNQAPKFEKYAE